MTVRPMFATLAAVAAVTLLTPAQAAPMGTGHDKMAPATKAGAMAHKRHRHAMAPAAKAGDAMAPANAMAPSNAMAPADAMAPGDAMAPAKDKMSPKA